ncbi:MAG: hypothetical protein LUQ66_10040, partial [Methanoregula sp.]|nr:hypothetical protein [Methanoregula sp.]
GEIQEYYSGRSLRDGVFMAKLIIEPKKTKEGQIEYIVNYHDPKSDNSFMVTTTSDLNEAIDRLKSTLESEVQTMLQKK